MSEPDDNWQINGTRCAEFAWRWVGHVLPAVNATERTELPVVPTPFCTFLFFWNPGLHEAKTCLGHQPPVVLINPGTEGRNHLPSCVPISSGATAPLVCFHISGRMFQGPRQTDGGSLFHTALDYSFFLLRAAAQFLPQFVPSLWL